MKRLLCIVATMNTGGAETFLMKIYRNLDLTKYQMDFCVSIQEDGFYDHEIIDRGGKIHRVPQKSKNPLKTFISIKKIVKQNHYNYVMRVNQHSLSTLDLIAAKAGGAKNLIMRSSNAKSGNISSEILHRVFGILPKIVPTIKIAPSKLAGSYTFGKRAVEKNEVYILHNAIDINQFEFSYFKRNLYRKKIDLEDKFVLGHIGRFSEQKNHEFLIRVFFEVKKEIPNAVLLLVGDGELKEKIINQVNELGLSEDVFFLGIRSDIPELLMAMDVFVFPSLYEGMPNTVIEAQATGLPCVISNTITEEVGITDLVEFLSIKAPSEQWLNKISYIKEKLYKRKDTRDVFIERGYEIENVTRKFERYIFNNKKERI